MPNPAKPTALKLLQGNLGKQLLHAKEPKSAADAPPILPYVLEVSPTGATGPAGAAGSTFNGGTITNPIISRSITRAQTARSRVALRPAWPRPRQGCVATICSLRPASQTVHKLFERYTEALCQ